MNEKNNQREIVPESMERHKIVIIDDDTVILSLFEIFLKNDNFAPVTFLSGRDGIDYISENSVDAVILDLNMPEISGFEVLEILKGVIPKVPIIVISGTGDMNDAIKALTMGAWDFLIKPVEELSIISHTLSKNIERALLKKKSAQYRNKLEQTLNKLKEGEIAAKKIQEKMFPPSHSNIHDLDILCYTLPSEYLSGDFIDYFSINNSFIFYLADISGHGVASALVTVILRDFIRKQVMRFKNKLPSLIFNPNDILSELNSELINEDLGKHMTIFYGIIDIDSNVLKYANGGQFPPPLLTKKGSSKFFGSGGSSLGLFQKATFECGEITLSKNFSINLFSDGILELFNEKNIKDKLLKLQTFSSQLLINDYIDNFLKSREQPDDISILSITS